MKDLALTPKQIARITAPQKGPLKKWAVLLAVTRPDGGWATWHGAIGSPREDTAILCARALAAKEFPEGSRLSHVSALDVNAALAKGKPITTQDLAERRAA